MTKTGINLRKLIAVSVQSPLVILHSIHTSTAHKFNRRAKRSASKVPISPPELSTMVARLSQWSPPYPW